MDLKGAIGYESATPASAAMPTAYAQTYRNTQVPNMRQALYALSIRYPNKAKTAQFSYTFPLSPSNLRRTRTSMATFYDTQGSFRHNGVTRLVDQYGLSPIVFDIEGTTGWQKHLTDGFKYTGLKSVQTLLNMLDLFAVLNSIKSESQGSDFYTMEFYDYFTETFYEVVPVGPQQVWQDSQKPLLTNYKFHLVGIRSIAAPALPSGSTTDPIAAAFGAAVSTVQATVSGAMSGISSLYGSAQSVASSVL